jgi:hypothetical protein
MKGKTLIHLGADIAAGGFAAEAIGEQLGDGLVPSLVAGAGGIVAGIGTGVLLEAIDNETGIVSDLGSVVDDIFSIF